VSNLILIVLAFVGVLLVPGFAMSLALFPRFYDLDMTERLAMAIGLSLVIVVFLGMILDFAGSLIYTGGITPNNMLVSLGSTTILFLVIWAFRRARMSRKKAQRQQI
jgi:uncharacterized membrane protein